MSKKYTGRMTLLYRKPQIEVLSTLCLIFSTSLGVAYAHEVKTAKDVGAILHIEPHDNPRAGEPAKAWFALTHKGGKLIPLAECNCQLAVYSEPHDDKNEPPPLLKPTLRPVTAEQYQGIPGTEITFPKPGGYELHFSGKPVDGKSFQPFELEYEVTVAQNTQTFVQQTPTPAQQPTNVNENLTQSETKQIPLWAMARKHPVEAIALPGVVGIGILFFVVRWLRKR